MSAQIYHNPRCSKSREALEIIRAAGVEPQIIEYLKTPPSAAELEDILTKLGKQPREIIRTGEAIYKELDLKNRDLSRADLIEIMAAHPILIERPIVITPKGATLGRPPEAVKAIL